MKILPPSQLPNLPIIEQVLEEVRLNVLDHLFDLENVRDLFSLDSSALKQKVELLGLHNIQVGRYISLDLTSDEFQFISPQFYKMYRKVNQHRGNKMSMDYIFHSAGMMNTLLHSNTEFYSASSVFDTSTSFFDFNTFRDNQFPELGIGDGYIIVPYTSNKSQTLKSYLSKNPIIFQFLPAGYTFIFLSDYRNGNINGVLQYDNMLSYEDITNLAFLYWEDFDSYPSEDVYILPDGQEFTYSLTLYFYDPFLFRDKGLNHHALEYQRFQSDQVLYTLPITEDGIQYPTPQDLLLKDLFDLEQQVLEEYYQGYESNLNNTLMYRDIWLGDYLLPYLKGANRYIEGYDHVKGLIVPQSTSYSYASLYRRGESLASQYFQRKEKVVPTPPVRKQEVISDRAELDVFKFHFFDEYSIHLVTYMDREQAITLIQTVFSVDHYTASFIVDGAPSIARDGMTLEQAQSYFNQAASLMTSLTVFAIIDSNGNVVEQTPIEFTGSDTLSSYNFGRMTLSLTLGELSVPVAGFAFFTSNGEATTVDTSLDFHNALYNSDGSSFNIEPEYTYKLLVLERYTGSSYDPSTNMLEWSLSPLTYNSMALYLNCSLLGDSSYRSLRYIKEKAVLKTVYLSPDKSPVQVNRETNYLVYDEDGHTVPVSSVVYTLDVVAYYYVEGVKIYNVMQPPSPRLLTSYFLTNSNGKLVFRSNSSLGLVDKVEYSTQVVRRSSDLPVTTHQAYFRSDESSIDIDSDGSYALYDDAGNSLSLDPFLENRPKHFGLQETTDTKIPGNHVLSAMFKFVSSSAFDASVEVTLTSSLLNQTCLTYTRNQAPQYEAYLDFMLSPVTLRPTSFAVLRTVGRQSISAPIHGETVFVLSYYVSGERIMNSDRVIQVSFIDGFINVSATREVVVEKVIFSVQPYVGG